MDKPGEIAYIRNADRYNRLTAEVETSAHRFFEAMRAKIALLIRQQFPTAECVALNDGTPWLPDYMSVTRIYGDGQLLWRADEKEQLADAIGERWAEEVTNLATVLHQLPCRSGSLDDWPPGREYGHPEYPRYSLALPPVEEKQ